MFPLLRLILWCSSVNMTLIRCILVLIKLSLWSCGNKISWYLTSNVHVITTLAFSNNMMASLQWSSYNRSSFHDRYSLWSPQLYLSSTCHLHCRLLVLVHVTQAQPWCRYRKSEWMLHSQYRRPQKSSAWYCRMCVDCRLSTLNKLRLMSSQAL